MIDIMAKKEVMKIITKFHNFRKTEGYTENKEVNSGKQFWSSTSTFHKTYVHS